MQAILFLSLCQIKNAFRASVRNPAVWIPVLLMAFLAPSQIRAQLFSQSPLPSDVSEYLTHHVGLVHAGVFTALALLGLGYLDTGFSGGALKFTSSDVALLFPTPLSRRIVLLFKLPSALASQLLMIGLLSWGFRLIVWLPMLQGHNIYGSGWASLLAAFLCVAGFSNIASLLNLYSAVRRINQTGRIYRIACFLVVIALGRFLWTHGSDGLAAIDHSALASAFFLPCRVAADVIVSPFHSVQLSGTFWVFLFGWYGLTAALLLTRRVNYYEAGAVSAERAELVRQAIRSGNWAAIGGVPTQASRKSHSLPLFGQGGGALLWAHLSAAAKRPTLNFATPFLGGIGTALAIGILMTGAGIRQPDYSAAPVAAVKIGLGVTTGYYIFYIVALVGTAFYQRALARETLIRPLPMPIWQTVGAEIAARSFLGALYPLGEAIGLVALRLPGTGAEVFALLVAAPMLIVCLNALSYRLALSYPNQSDKLQALAAGFIQFLSYGILALAILPFLIVPLMLHGPAWTSFASAAVGIALLTALLFHNTVRAATMFESSEDPPPLTIRHWAQDFRKNMSSPPLKKAAKPIVIAVVIVGIIAFVGARINQALHKPKPPPQTVETRVGEITVKVSETGTIQPVDKVNVESKAPGRLLSIPITEGERVKKGQLIAIVDRSQLDPQIAGLRAQMAQAQARLMQTKAQYALQVTQNHMAVAQAKAALHSSETHLAAVAAPSRSQDIAQQKQAVDRAQITLDDAHRTQKRREALLAKGFIAQADADTAQVAVDTASSALASAKAAFALTLAGPRPQDVTDARAQVQAARVALAAAQANSGQNAVSHEDISQASAAVRQIHNQLAQLLVQLADTRIVAPASGIVLKKYKEPNEIVQSATTGFSEAQSMVATLGSRLEVQVGINEVDIPKVKVGAPVSIHVDALPGLSYAGIVTEVAPASTNTFSSSGDTTASASSATGISKFLVKVALDTYDRRLRPGMTANVDIIAARHSHVVLAPLAAIPGAGKAATVTILVGKSQRKQRVALGLRNDSDVEVTHGLVAGEKLVVPPINGADRRKFDLEGPS